MVLHFLQKGSRAYVIGYAKPVGFFDGFKAALYLY